MAHPNKLPNKACPREPRSICPLQCRYNHFENAEGLTIDSWDLKCLDCGLRETVAYRSDEREADDTTDPRQCPFCQLTNLPNGINSCQGR